MEEQGDDAPQGPIILPKLGDLPKFSGDGSESFAAFIHRFSNSLVFLTGVPEAQWPRFLAACFIGKAAEVILAVYPPGDEPDLFAQPMVDVVAALRPVCSSQLSSSMRGKTGSRQCDCNSSQQLQRSSRSFIRRWRATRLGSHSLGRKARL